MPHLHTAPGQHDLTVSLFLVRTDGPEPVVLLHHHRSLGVWMQTGGHVELTETTWQAVAHELREETGYELDQVAVLQPALRLGPLPDNDVHPQPICLRTVPVARGVEHEHWHIDLGFALVTAEAPRLAVSPGESTELAWLTRRQLLDLPAGETYEDVRQIHLYILDRLLDAWPAVPAAEADWDRRPTLSL